jgi:hypothetical protein
MIIFETSVFTNYWYVSEDQIYMLLAYGKNEKDDLTEKQKQILRKIVEENLK